MVLIVLYCKPVLGVWGGPSPPEQLVPKKCERQSMWSWKKTVAAWLTEASHARQVHLGFFKSSRPHRVRPHAPLCQHRPLGEQRPGLSPLAPSARRRLWQRARATRASSAHVTSQRPENAPAGSFHPGSWIFLWDNDWRTIVMRLAASSDWITTLYLFVRDN